MLSLRKHLHRRPTRMRSWADPVIYSIDAIKYRRETDRFSGRLCLIGQSSSPSDSPLEIPTRCIIFSTPYYDIVASFTYAYNQNARLLSHRITTTYHLYRGSITTMWYFWRIHIISTRQYLNNRTTTMNHNLSLLLPQRGIFSLCT